MTDGWIQNLFFFLYISITLAWASEKNPIIIIPGDGGCQAYCQIQNSTAPPFLIWLDLRYLWATSVLDQYFSLVYDPSTRTTKDRDIGQIIFPGWGETWSIENLDTYKHGKTEYCGPLINALRLDPFFVTNKTIRGAPFDFRRAPNENVNFSRDLKVLIEETYQNAGDSRVVLLGHSLGSKYALFFLKSQSKSWKKKYIKSFVALSAPLGGSIKALKIEASGDNLGFILCNPLNFRTVQRTLPSLAFLLPDPRLWSPNEALIVTPTTNYSAHDYERFFRDINFTAGYEMMLDTQSTVDGFEAPTDVDEIYCIHGSNLSTADQMIYSPPNFFHRAFPDQAPTIVYGNGDSTVSLRSLEVCKHWPNVKYFVLPGAEHVSIMGDGRLIELIRNIVGAKSP